MKTDRLEERREEEAARLLSWRAERFQELGFTTRQSVRLVDSGADWHEVRDLLERGCSRPLVVKIVS